MLQCPECKIKNKCEIIDWSKKLVKCTACGMVDDIEEFQVEPRSEKKATVKPYGM